MSILSTLAGALEGAAHSNPIGTGAGGAGPGTGSLIGTASGAVVLSQIVSMIQSRPGGLAGMLQSLQQGGLGHLVQSWIGTGANQPVSDWLSKLSQLTGMSQGEVEQHVSTVLPQIVDHLSPNGQLPSGDLGSELATLAQRYLQR